MKYTTPCMGIHLLVGGTCLTGIVFLPVCRIYSALFSSSSEIAGKNTRESIRLVW